MECGSGCGTSGCVLHTFLWRRFFPRLPLVRFEPVLLNMDSSLRRRFSPLCPSLESGDGFCCVVFSFTIR